MLDQDQPQFLIIELFEPGDPGALPGRANAHFVGRATDPSILRGVEQCRDGIADQRFKGNATANDTDRAAVLRRRVIKPIGKFQAPGALYIDGNDRRVSGKVLSDMTRKEAPIGVVTAAYGKSDVKRKDIVFVELFHTLCVYRPSYKRR